MKAKVFVLLAIFISQFSFAHVSSCETKDHFCSLSQLHSDPHLLKQFIFSKDPAGLGAEARTTLKNAEQSLQNYANKHNCELYMLSMFNLVQGLLKGSSLPDMKNQNNSSQMQGIEKKIIILDGSKAVCIKKLGLNLPLKTITPSSKSKLK